MKLNETYTYLHYCGANPTTVQGFMKEALRPLAGGFELGRLPIRGSMSALRRSGDGKATQAHSHLSFVSHRMIAGSLSEFVGKLWRKCTYCYMATIIQVCADQPDFADDHT